MQYYLTLNYLFLTIGITALLIYLYLYYRHRKLLDRIQNQAFKEEHRRYLRKTPHYNQLSVDEKQKIERSIIEFTYTKSFIGVGLDISDEMKVVIAFYACLLLLHVKKIHCYPNLSTIIVYPTPVVLENISNNGGIYAKEQFMIDGQSNSDTVIIIWHDARHEAYHLRHNNVIVHEFAHEIDFLDGEIDGVPPIEKSKYHEWSNVLYSDFNRLNDIAQKNREWGKYKLIGSYAATNEAEFFAVITERYFESPHALQREFPELYNLLHDFYNINTLRLVTK